MSDLYDYVIREFGNSMGVKDLSLSGNNAINLNVENVGDVFIERSSKGISMSMVKEVKSYPSIDKDDLCKRFLEKCHFEENRTNFPIQLGMDNENSFVFMITLTRGNLQVQNLHKGIEILKEISIG